ncbi:uncharacterized protein [Miscanthus floridulus]|uniref:uncharacterized protein n=1 Tax=Miscanthus floridulus TaxID=154761 RepID=UPI0034581466
MAASLVEFDDPIGDRQMVLTLRRGLGSKFRHMVSILKMHRPFPMFAEARTHLLLEEMEIDARPPSPLSALVAATSWPMAPGAPAPPRLGAPPPTCPLAPTSGQHTGRRRSRGGRGAQQGQSAHPGGVPPGGQGAAPPRMHPTFVYPWAGTVRMWPYDQSARTPPPPPMFSAVPQYCSFGGTPNTYGGTYGAPPPPYGTFYGGPTPLVFQAPAPAYQVTPASPSVHGTVPVHGPIATPRHAPHSTEPQLLVPHSVAASALVPQGAATSAPPSSGSWSHGPLSPGTVAPVPRAQAATSSAFIPMEIVRTAGSAAPIAPA